MDMQKLFGLLENLKYLEHLPEIQRLLESGAQIAKVPVNLPDPLITERTIGTGSVSETIRSVSPKVEPVENPISETDKKEVPEDYIATFEELKSLVEGSVWPAAIDSDLICDDNNLSDKLLRAEGIIEFMIDESLENKKFLDFGCGEGHIIVKSLEKKPFLSVGYDITDQDWSSLPLQGTTGLVTTHWDEVTKNGPYDLILIYDVLDHVEGTSVQVVEVLKKAKSVLKPGGRLYIRCHPWTSRHATHLYQKINKAYLHLVFSDVELARMGYGGGLKCQRIIHPHATYKQWFNDAELDLVNETAIQENLEDFFHQTPRVNDRIRANYKGVSLDADLAAGRSFPSFQLRIQMIDYILKSL